MQHGKRAESRRKVGSIEEGPAKRKGEEKKEGRGEEGPAKRKGEEKEGRGEGRARRRKDL